MITFGLFHSSFACEILTKNIKPLIDQSISNFKNRIDEEIECLNPLIQLDQLGVEQLFAFNHLLHLMYPLLPIKFKIITVAFRTVSLIPIVYFDKNVK